MSRIFKRPMFRRGGEVGGGIMTGVMRENYQDGSTRERLAKVMAEYPSTAMDPLTQFLIQGGLSLASQPATGGGTIADIATALQRPTAGLMSGLAEKGKMAREIALQGEILDIEGERLKEKLASAEKIAGMKTIDDTKRIQEIADANYEGNTIKAKRQVDFATITYPDLVKDYGEESVSTDTIDSSTLQKTRDIERFVKANPELARQVVYDVATGKPIRFVMNTETNKYEIVPASSTDIDTTGETQPIPKKTGPDFTYLSPSQSKKLKEIQEASDSEFGMGFYE